MKNESFSTNLKAPFRLLTSVTRYKCLCCGNISEMNLNSTQKFIRVMGMLGNFPEIVLEGEADFKKYYFEVGHCPKCRHRGKELLIKLKALK